MAVGSPKTTGKNGRPRAKKAASEAVTKSGPPTIRDIAKKVARMSLEERLQIMVRAGLMSTEKAQAAAQRPSKARQSPAKKRAPKTARRKSSS
jgi:hypothetical protein